MRLMRILIAAGGSGGHIFPAIALYRSLKEEEPGIEIKFVGSAKELDRRIFEKEGVGYSLVSDNKLPYGVSFKSAAFLFKSFVDIIRMARLFRSFRPDVVVGFGGYVSFPAVLTANFFKIPKVMHEQNVACGRANRYMLSWVDKVALSFEETKKFLGEDARKAVFTGNPIRGEMLVSDRREGSKRFGFDRSKFTILVIGGSQGAHTLNEKFIEAVSLIREDVRASFQVIHITGVKDYEWALGKYSNLKGIDHRVFSFIDRIEEAYSAADLVIARSGSSCLFELASFGRAMILVPYPFAMSHQSENAQVFSEKGAAITIEEKMLSAEAFKDSILKLFNDRSRLSRMGAAARRLGVPEASRNLAREVLVCGKK